jgi:hypothetical protein
MANGTAQTFQAGAEVDDPTGTWILPMGNGATQFGGYGQAAYVHDTYACLNDTCYSNPFMTVTGSLANYNWWSAAGTPSWSNWFYYGDEPTVFWGQNYGFQWSPISDWAVGSYKGECGITSLGGSPITGVTAFTSGSHQAHAILCGDVTFPVTPSGCYVRRFDPGNNQGSTGAPDWDRGYYKADCRNTEYVSGVSQSGAGAENGILCCPASGLSHASCGTQTFYAQNSAAYYSSGSADFDWGFDKGLCPAGDYVAGVSAVASGSNIGAPHAIWCCSP